MALDQGTYLCDAKANTLRAVAGGDLWLIMWNAFHIAKNENP